MSKPPFNIRSRKSLLTILVMGAAFFGAIVFSGCTDNTPSTDWSSPNGNLKNTRYVGGRINKGTIDNMGVAWTVDINTKGAFGAMATTPIITGSAVYVQDLKSNVYSYDLRTGSLNWEHKYNEDNIGPNGLTFNGKDGGRIYGATTSFPFALDAKTGKEIWRTEGLADPKGFGFTIAPQVYDGRVQISTAAQPGGGIAYALDQETGKVRWSWNSVKPGQGVAGGKVNDGGSWNAPLVHGDDVFWGIANPYQSIKSGTETPERGLYIDSTVSLTQKSGVLNWYNQAVPNDFYDWDMQISPILTTGKDDQELVLDAGKHGQVFAFNAATGKTVWKTPVGKHNGHDNDSANALKKNGKFKPKSPMTVFPGTLGGVETNMAVADQTVFVASSNLPATYKDFSSTDVLGVLPAYDKGSGNLTAINTEDGKVKWTKPLASMPLGAVTVANDLVFITEYNGNIFAFDKGSGDQVWTSKLPAGTNSPIAISDDTIIVPAGVVGGAGQKAQIVAFRIGGLGQIGGAAAPKQTLAPEAGRAEATTPGKAEASTDATAAPKPAAAPAIDAKTIFTQNCGGCHVLANAGTAGAVGPNLDDLKPNAALVEKQVTNGGGGMPAFKGTLSPAEIKALAAYVSSVAGKG